MSSSDIGGAEELSLDYFLAEEPQNSSCLKLFIFCFFNNPPCSFHFGLASFAMSCCACDRHATPQVMMNLEPLALFVRLVVGFILDVPSRM